MPKKEEDLAAMQRILAAHANEKATFQFGKIHQEPDGEGEGPGRYALCCDRSKQCYCKGENTGILNLGTAEHHRIFHTVIGEEEPLPPTKYQSLLR